MFLWGKPHHFNSLGRKFKYGHRKSDLVQKELPNPETGASISSSHFVFDMANWGRKMNCFLSCMSRLSKHIIRKQKHAFLPQQTSSRATRKCVDVTLLVQMDVNNKAWFKINRKIHSCKTLILCLNGPICAHNTFSSTLQALRVECRQAASINTIVSIIFIIRLLFEIIH